MQNDDRNQRSRVNNDPQLRSSKDDRSSFVSSRRDLPERIGMVLRLCDELPKPKSQNWSVKIMQMTSNDDA